MVLGALLALAASLGLGVPSPLEAVSPGAGTAVQGDGAGREDRPDREGPRDPASSGKPRAVAFSVGAFNIDGSLGSVEVGLEGRFDTFEVELLSRTWDIEPALGVMFNADGAFYGYLGFRLDVPLSERWTLTPQSAIGYYDRGQSKVLGSRLQFRSGLEADYRLTERWSVSTTLYHLSNAGISDTNPGTESLVVAGVWRP